MSLFIENVLKPTLEKGILKLPFVKKGCKVVEVVKLQNGNYRLDFYVLNNDGLFYFAFNSWQAVPHLSYLKRRDEFYLCEQI